MYLSETEYEVRRSNRLLENQNDHLENILRSLISIQKALDDMEKNLEETCELLKRLGSG